MRKRLIALLLAAAVSLFPGFVGCDKASTINVDESIIVTDSSQTSQSAVISIIETIGVADSPQTSSSAGIRLTETVGVIDSALILPSIAISLIETVYVSDSSVVTSTQVQPPPPPPAQVTVTVTSPKAGVVWVVGTTQNIAWMTTGEGIAFVGIYYSIDGGKSMYAISQKASNDGIYTWKVPNIPSKNVLVRVLAYNATGTTLALGDSGLFTISVQ
jgi:hypothetical protein